ncbi:hypothetical protein D3C72_2362770 [compost metagenome]
MNHSIATGFEKVEKHFEYADKNFAILNRNIDLIKGDIDLVKGNINLIKGNSTASLETVENSILNLTTEISKINDTSGYEGLYANMKIVGKL